MLGDNDFESGGCNGNGCGRITLGIAHSVAVDLDIAQLVDVPNLGVTAILNRDIFKP